MKASVNSIGCRLNQAEIRKLGWKLEEHGVDLVVDDRDSDVIIINSCTVTAPAAADSRSRIRSAQKKNPAARIIVTGCWATMEPESAADLVGQQNVIPNHSKDSILHLILHDTDTMISPPQLLQVKPAFQRTRAFIKVQDGCNHACSYCITTIARGSAVSIPVEQIVEDISREIDFGAKEAVLTGVQLNNYGSDLHHTDLADLIEAVLAKTSIARLRLSSIEPWNIPDHLFDLWGSSRLCRHLHLPLQSGCNETLKRMRRPYSRQRYEHLVNLAAEKIPGLAISTDIITGFPGESEEDFQSSLAFVKEMPFSAGHVFSYSPRQGTAAENLPGRITEGLIKERTRRMQTVFQKKQTEFSGQAINDQVDVLWEKAKLGPDGSWLLSGWSDTYLRIHAKSPSNHYNEIQRVKIVGRNEQGLLGQLPD